MNKDFRNRVFAKAGRLRGRLSGHAASNSPPTIRPARDSRLPRTHSTRPEPKQVVPASMEAVSSPTTTPAPTLKHPLRSPCNAIKEEFLFFLLRHPLVLKKQPISWLDPMPSCFVKTVLFITLRLFFFLTAKKEEDVWQMEQIVSVRPPIGSE
ncbi:hypothetical protein NDU88_001343 [Pleurodeles waltl]|uniref:Uncharacterized protein n=1 Tax=Pleurodeles waltl TaxID=8319 RepID=A0AAV7TI14_PLEWA|nr:hypothetical protein NDU88_001343 [Pleurodeles waltl]